METIMYILYVKMNGKAVAWAATSKREVTAWVKETQASIPEMHWRLHDGSGWCDGSPDAWKELPNEWASSFEGILRNRR
jgi:hypothetical protein